MCCRRHYIFSTFFLSIELFWLMSVFCKMHVLRCTTSPSFIYGWKRTTLCVKVWRTPKRSSLLLDRATRRSVKVPCFPYSSHLSSTEEDAPYVALWRSLLASTNQCGGLKKAVTPFRVGLSFVFQFSGKVEVPSDPQSLANSWDLPSLEILSCCNGLWRHFSRVRKVWNKPRFLKAKLR